VGTNIVNSRTGATEILATRYDSDGSLDSSFGNNGVATISDPHFFGPTGEAILQPDGKIVIAGPAGPVRLNPDGNVDTSFGTQQFFSGPAAVAIQPDGKIVEVSFVSGVDPANFSIARFDSNGTLDPSFGNGGLVSTNFGGPGQATSIVLESNGKILVGGGLQNNGSTSFALARYNANGSLDTGFGMSGVVTIAIGAGGSMINGLALQADGCLIAVGSQPRAPTAIPSSADLARFLLPPSQNEQFVDQLYRDLLGRQVDPVGLTVFLNALDEGIITRMQMAQIIEASPEYRTDVVEGMYTSFLGRMADSGGLQAWVSMLNAGATIEQVKSGILGSPEYFQLKGGTNASFLQGLYHDILSRPIDATGAAAWGAELASGTGRDVVAIQILGSAEAESDLVASVYEHYLHRAPEAAGLSFWLTQLQQGLRDENLIAGVAGSAEYFSHV